MTRTALPQEGRLGSSWAEWAPVEPPGRHSTLATAVVLRKGTAPFHEEEGPGMACPAAD